jgi:hypothetical protein
LVESGASGGGRFGRGEEHTESLATSM